MGKPWSESIRPPLPVSTAAATNTERVRGGVKTKTNYQTALRGDSPRSLQLGSSCRPTSRSLIPAGLLSPKISSLLRTGRNLCFLPFEANVFTNLSCTSNLIYLPTLTEFCSSVPAFISLLQPKNTL